jgi:transposase-like protein
MMRQWNLEKVVGLVRMPRRHRSVAGKRRIVALALQPGMSVARMAQTEGVNATRCSSGGASIAAASWLGAAESATALLPVVVATASSENCVELSAPVAPTPAAPSSAINIELPGRATIRVEHGADRALLQTILSGQP